MQIILLERVEKLGQMGDTVTVKDGYARNYLLPQKKALRATKDNVTFFENQRTILEARNLERKEEAQTVASRMTDVMVVIIRTASESGHLYGSVRAADISEQMEAQGYQVNRAQIKIDKPIKELGIHNVTVMLHPEVVVVVKANVAQSVEEADVQAGKAPIQEAGENNTEEDAPDEGLEPQA